MHKSSLFVLACLLALSAAPGLRAAQEGAEAKSLQSLPSQSDALSSPSNSAQVDPEDDSLASEASKDFSDGGKSLGRGFVKGAQVTGNAFKTAGKAMGRGFKKAGSAIRDYFAGKPDSVEERNLEEGSGEGSPEAARDPGAEALDAVGNELPRQAEPKRISRETPAQDSQFN